MYNTEDSHSEIRLITVNKIINEWKHYKDFRGDVSKVNSVEDYKNLCFRNGEYGGNVELTCVSHSFPDYLCRVHYKNKTNAFDYSCM